MQKTISTEDLYLAAYLVTCELNVAGHERSQGRSIFHFTGPGLEDLVNKYYADNVRVSPSEFGQAIRSLKALMYNGTTIQPYNEHDTAKRNAIV